VVLIPENDVQRVMEDGRTYIATGKYDEAVKCFDWVLEQNPNNAEAWNGKGTALTASEKSEDAIACFDMALQLNPDLAFAWRNKGKALDKLGRDGEAQECYDKSDAIANKMAAPREVEAAQEERAPPKKRFGFWNK
jgi:tetratricopeptide (TPR) repeat protein